MSKVITSVEELTPEAGLDVGDTWVHPVTGAKKEWDGEVWVEIVDIPVHPAVPAGRK